MLRALAIILSLTLLSVKAIGGERVDTHQGVMEPSFKTLKVTLNGELFPPPVINLADPSERIVISFDELANQHRYLRYTL